MDHEHKHQGAKNFFFYFLMFALLYCVAINLGGLLFDIIDKVYGVPGSFRVTVTPSSLRFHLASLIIATPIFLFFARKLHGEAKINKELRHSTLRRWLTYITLLLTTLVVVGDLIAVVFHLLGGDTTIQFTLKALVILVIAAAILYYYLQDVKSIRHERKEYANLPKIYFLATAALVLLSVISGFFFISSPAEQRLKNNDEERLVDLRSIQYAIDRHYQIKQILPESLDELDARPSTLQDPITKISYEYIVLSDTNYELCAEFETSNLDEESYDRFSYDGAMLHKTGRTCFEQTVVKNLDERQPGKVIEPLPVAEF
jgi:hypothetical protein